MSALIRLQQGLRAMIAWAHHVDYAQAETILNPAEMALFRRLRRSEQIHCLNVLNALLDAGEDDPDLLTASLLHDVGKTVGPFNLPERTIVVLVRKIVPQFYYRWGQAEPRGWKRPFAISLRHPEWSAQMMAEAGCSERAIALSRQHQEILTRPPENDFERLLITLQTADNLH